MSRYSYRKNGFDFGDFEITKREILASISIIAVMLLIGVLISGKISEHQMDKNEMYNKAVKIESTDIFKYGMRTNVGNAFIYGDLESVDTVTYPELDEKYMYVKKVKEKYTRHTKRVKSGNTYHTKTYWTWDKVSSDSIRCKKIKFCGVQFSSKKIKIPETHYIDTIKVSSHIRYKYYGTNTKFTGTIFTDLRDNTISNDTEFYNKMDISNTVEYLESGGWNIIFWIVWIILLCFCVFGFYYFDNKWLE